MTKAARLLASLIGLAALAPHFAAASALSVEQLRKVIETQRAQVHSMRGKITAVTTPDPVAEAAGQMRNIGQNLHIEFAWSGEKRMLIDDGDWVAGDLKTNHSASVNVFDGKDYRRKTGKTFLIQPLKSGYSETNIYLYDIKWPITEAQMIEVRDYSARTQFLPECLKDPRWRVLPEEERVGEVACVVVEKPPDGWRMSFDPRRNYCLMRAEYDNPGVRMSRTVYDYGDFRQVLPGLYLPMTVAAATSMRTEEGKPVGTLTNRVTVQELRVNDVKGDAFVLEPSPGDYVIDKIHNQTYSYVKSDDETLDVVAEKAVLDVADLRRQRTMNAFLIFSGVAVSTVIALRGLSSFLRRRGGSRPAGAA